MTNIQKIPLIEKLVPHSVPMILIDKLIRCQATSATAEVAIHAKSYFIQDAGVPTWVGIEYMAQTVAAYAGYHALQASSEVSIGFLLGTRKFETTVPFFKVGQTYEIHITHLFEDEGLACFDCQISAGLQGVCQARINCYQPKNMNDFTINNI